MRKPLWTYLACCVAVFMAGLFGIVFGLIRGNSHGWTSAQVLGSLAVGGLLIVAFGARESRALHPMMPLSLFRSRGFSAASATMLLTNMGMFGVIFLVSQFLQSVMGYTPLGAGVHGLPWTAAPAVAARSPGCSPTASAAGGSSPSASRCRRSASAGSPP